MDGIVGFVSPGLSPRAVFLLHEIALPAQFRVIPDIGPLVENQEYRDEVRTRMKGGLASLR